MAFTKGAHIACQLFHNLSGAVSNDRATTYEDAKLAWIMRRFLTGNCSKSEHDKCRRLCNIELDLNQVWYYTVVMVKGRQARAQSQEKG